MKDWESRSGVAGAERLGAEERVGDGIWDWIK